MSEWKPTEEKPLKGVTRCKKTDCAKELHCFLKDRKRKTPEGTCLDCGTNLVDWPRLHRRDLTDLDHTISALKREHIRHDFWCNVQLTQKATTYAHKHGRSGIINQARTRVAKKLVNPGPMADWGQTPFEANGNAVHFAQHATATCCRRCIEVWHGVSRSETLTPDTQEYFAQLILRYVLDRIPDLPPHPRNPVRKTSRRVVPNVASS